MKSTRQPQSARNPALDVIRLTALFSVVAVHYFKNTGFYNVTVSGLQMYIATLIRTFFMICVPLFILLSGYLMKNKKPTAGYYQKLIKTLVIYILASICCILVKASDIHDLRQLAVFFVHQLSSITAYRAAPYSWYVEMYIGLFLLVPYLNVLYNGLDGQAARARLILTLLILTAFPSVINIYQLSLRWWLQPSSVGEYYQILPQWWTGIYPITYYFIGAYLRDYPLKLGNAKSICLIVIVFFASGSFSYYRSHGVPFLWGSWQSHESLPVVIQSVLVFHLLSQLNCSSMSQAAETFLGRLSDLCFGAYLVSWIFDQWFYRAAGFSETDSCFRMVPFFLIVPAVFVCSLSLSGLLNLCYALFSRVLRKRPNPSSAPNVY